MAHNSHKKKRRFGPSTYIEDKKIVLLNLEMLRQKLQTGLEDAGFCVLEGNSKQYHGSSILPVKVDSFSSTTPRYTEEDCPPATVASSSIIFDCERCFNWVLSFDKHELEFS